MFKAQEERATAVLSKSHNLAKSGFHREALQVTHEYLANKRILMRWTSKHVDVMREHINLCVTLRRTDALHAPFKNFRQASIVQDPKQMEHIIMFALDLCEKVEQDAKKEVESGETITAQDEAIALLTNSSPKQLLQQRSMEKACQFHQEMLRQCLFAIKDTGSLDQLFHKIIQRGFANSTLFQRRYDADNIAYMLHSHFRDATEKPGGGRSDYNRHHREQYASNTERVDTIIETRIQQLSTALKFNNWRNVGNAINETRQVLTTLREMKKPVKQVTPAQFKLYAEVFFAVSNHVFHAHCAAKHARLRFYEDRERGQQAASEETRLFASQAVLALLCVPKETGNPVVVVQSFDRDREQALQLARSIGSKTKPTRDTVSNDVLQSAFGMASLLDSCFPAVRQLYDQLFEVNSVSVCQKIKPLMDEIEAYGPEMSKYVPFLRSVAVKSMVGMLSTCFSDVSLDFFTDLCGFFSRDEYNSKVEPMLLACSDELQQSHNVKVVIDHRNKRIRFAPATATTEISTDLNQVVTKLTFPKPSARVTTLVNKENPAKALSGKLMDQIESERQRVIQRTELAALRIGKTQQRHKLELKKEQERKQEEQAKNRRMEEDRIAKARKEVEDKIVAKIAELEGVERRKIVVRNLVKKYPGFVVPPSMPSLSEAQFAEALSLKLYQHRRKQEETRLHDVRMMDYFERACRDVEVPKIVAAAEANAESAKRLQKERIHNMRIAHKEEHEYTVQVKERLKKFEKQAARYESEKLAEAAEKMTVQSKLGKQEEQLEQERQKREEEYRQQQQQEKQDQQKKQQQQQPQPASSSSTSGGGGGGGAEPKPGAWRPKQRADGSGSGAPPSDGPEKEGAAPSDDVAAAQQPPKEDNAAASGGGAKPGKWVPKSRQ